MSITSDSALCEWQSKLAFATKTISGNWLLKTNTGTKSPSDLMNQLPLTIATTPKIKQDHSPSND